MLRTKYYKTYITIFKIFGLCTINIYENNTFNYNAVLIIYALSLCVTILALLIYSNVIFTSAIVTSWSGGVYLALAFAIVSTLINDKEYAALLKYLVETKLSLMHPDITFRSSSKKYAYRFAAGFILSLFNFISDIISFYLLNGGVFLLHNVMTFCHYVSFGKLTLLISEFIDVMVQLNNKTRDCVLKKQDIRELRLTYVKLEGKLLDGKRLLCPLLLTNVITNFLTIFIHPYVTANTAFPINPYTVTGQVRLVVELIKLFTLSHICDELVSEVSSVFC